MAAESIQEQFQSFEWPTDSHSNSRVYRYRLYVPVDGKKPTLWPIFIWFHGLNERGDDNQKNLRWMDLVFEAYGGRPPMFILVPQHHLDEFWYGADAQQRDALFVTHEILQQLLQTYPIDPDRVYVSGVSSGGNACWEFVSRYHDQIAAAAPLASNGHESNRPKAFTKIPIWAFHSKNDTKVLSAGVERSIETIRSLGGTAALTLTEWKPVDASELDHDCWHAAFQQYQVMDWLLAQCRGKPATWVPGTTVKQEVVVWFQNGGYVVCIYLCAILFALSLYFFYKK